MTVLTAGESVIGLDIYGCEDEVDQNRYGFYEIKNTFDLDLMIREFMEGGRTFVVAEFIEFLIYNKYMVKSYAVDNEPVFSSKVIDFYAIAKDVVYQNPFKYLYNNNACKATRTLI